MAPDTLTGERRWRMLGHPGLTVWFTGLPAAGKSTIARTAEARLLAIQRPAYVLEGEALGRRLNRDLGFARWERAESVRRTAEVAAMMADAGLIALAALVSPYAADRARARELHERNGLTFIEVFVNTPLEECVRRDPKQLYARARRGEITGVTGVDAPYEIPTDPDLEVAGGTATPSASVDRVLAALGIGRSTAE